MEDTVGVWLRDGRQRDGSLLYILEDTGEHWQGKSLLQNKLMVNIIRSQKTPQAELDALVEKIHAFLKKDAEKPTGEAMRAAVEEAHGAYREWLETTYPQGAIVEFTLGGNMLEGWINGCYFDQADDPYLYIDVKHGYHRVNPLKETVTVKSATPQS